MFFSYLLIVDSIFGLLFEIDSCWILFTIDIRLESQVNVQNVRRGCNIESSL